MKTSAPPSLRRSLSCAATVIVVGLMTACTGTGGGELPPTADFIGPATFGFDFGCERSSRSTSPNPPTGQLRIEVAYTDHGNSPIGESFGIHGIVDEIPPLLESAVCIGQDPPPGGNVLIFLGRYWLTTSPPAGFPESCPTRQTSTTPLCRFEVIVEDNDMNRAPSPGDLFSIKLSTVTETVTKCPADIPEPCFITEFPVGTVVYARAGVVERGNITVN